MPSSQTATSLRRRLLAGAPFVLSALAAAAAQAADAPAAQANDGAIVVAQAGATPAGATSSGDTKSKIEVIEVTASKRKERLIDAPSAITAISAEKMENLGVQNFQDYATLVPNLAQTSASGPGIGSIVLRGLYTGAQQTTATTAFYIGESPFTSSGQYAIGSFITPEVDLFDVARIEVLKGPQGTLYGSAALGGLIRVVPKLPDTETLSGSVRVGASKVSGGGDGYTGKFSLNVPLSPGLAGLQVSASKRQEGGFIKNVRTGSTNLGKSDFDGGSATLLLTPIKDLQVTLRALTQKNKTTGGYSQDNVLDTGTPKTGERQYSSPTDGSGVTQFDLGELSAEYQTPYGSVTATYSDNKSKIKLDTDASYYTQYIQAAFGLPATGTGPEFLNLDQHRKTYELRFTSKRFGDAEFLAGLFGTRENTDYHIGVAGADANGAPLAIPTPYGPLSNIIDSDTTSTYNEHAFFVNATYYLRDDIDISVGGRNAKNSQDFRNANSGVLTLQPIASQPVLSNSGSSDTSNTYQVTARWRPSSDLSTYARVATGYRPGGSQARVAAPFKPDTVTNYELGVKGFALDKRFTFDTAIYHIDWKDVQLNALIGGFVRIGNGGKATVDGIELQGAYSDPSGLTVGGGLGYNDAKLKEVDAATQAGLGANPGDQLPGSPKVSGSLYADYSFAAMGAYTASVGTTVRYQGSKHASYSGAGQLNPDFLMPAYTTLDLRANLRWDRFNLRFGVANVTDKNGYTGYGTGRVAVTQTSGPSGAILTRPRTYSVTFGADF